MNKGFTHRDLCLSDLIPPFDITWCSTWVVS